MTTYIINSYQPNGEDITIGKITVKHKNLAVLHIKGDGPTTYRPYGSLMAAFNAVKNRLGWQTAYLTQQKH